MPDIDINEEQDEVTDDALDAFNEDDSETEEKEEKEEKKTSEEEEAEDKEEEEEKPLSTQDKIEQRLKALVGDKEDKTEKDDKTEKEEDKKIEDKKEKPEKVDKEPPKVFSKEDIAKRIALISKDDLPENIIIGDEEINLREFAEDEPYSFNAIKVISSTIAEKIVNDTIADLQKKMNFVTPDKFEETIGKVGGSVQQIAFDLNLAQAMNDDGEIKYPTYFRDRQNIQVWAQDKGKENPKLVKLLSSWSLEDAMLALDLYYEEKAGKSVKDHKEKQKNAKNKYDALNSDTGTRHNTMRDKKPTFKDRKAEEKAAFDED